MSQVLRASENYVWSTLDVLGEGATGAVYKARHKVFLIPTNFTSRGKKSKNKNTTGVLPRT